MKQARSNPVRRSAERTKRYYLGNGQLFGFGLLTVVAGCSALGDFGYTAEPSSVRGDDDGGSGEQEGGLDADIGDDEAGDDELDSCIEGTAECDDASATPPDEPPTDESDAGTDACPGEGASCHDASQPAPAPPSVESVSPADKAVSVDTLIAASAVFSKEMDPNTPWKDQVYLMAGDERVLGDVRYEAGTRAVSFVPARRLRLLERYTMVVGADVVDLEGKPLGTSYSWSFTTRDGSWFAHKLDDRGSSDYPEVTLTSGGTAVALWQYWRLSESIWASSAQRDASGALEWVGQATIGTAAAVTSGRAALAATAADGALAVWSKAGEPTTIWARSFVREHGWLTPVPLDVGDSDAFNPLLATDNLGNAVAVWGDASGGIWASRLTGGGNWEDAPQPIGNRGSGAKPTLKMNGAGRAVVFWRTVRPESQMVDWAMSAGAGSAWEGPGSSSSAFTEFGYPAGGLDRDGNTTVAWAEDGRVRAARYLRVAGEWIDSGRRISADGAPAAQNVNVAVSAAGVTLTTWTQSDGLWSTDCSPARDWSTPKPISASPITGVPRILISPTGHALAIWTQSDGLWSNRYEPEGRWTGARAIHPLSQLNAFDAQMSTSGHAIVTWLQAQKTWASNYDPARRGWAPPTPIQKSDNPSGIAQIAMDARGNATVIWTERRELVDGSRREVWADRFSTTTQGWREAELLSPVSLSMPSFEAPRLAMNEAGDTIAAFILGVGSSGDVWVTEFR